MNVNGYETKTTFWMDFSIADHFGTRAIKDTYRRASEEWKHDAVYMTELVLVLNWKCWPWHQKNSVFCSLYSDLYYKARDLAMDTLTGDDLQYFFRTTD